jgi:hypothetical protein
MIKKKDLVRCDGFDAIKCERYCPHKIPHSYRDSCKIEVCNRKIIKCCMMIPNFKNELDKILEI